MKKERGNVIILVMILLAMSSLAIGNTISYTSSALKSYSVTSDVMIEQYSADAALENAIWHLKNNEDFPDNPGINRETLIPGGTTSAAYSFSINDMDVSVQIELPDELPETEPVSHALLGFQLARDPLWMKTGNSINYDFTLTNTHNNKNLEISEVGASLSPGLEYIPGSSGGLSTNEPVITIEQGCQKLSWPHDPLYILGPKTSAVQYYSAQANVDGGIYYSSAGANYRSPGLDWEPFYTGWDAPVWISTYHITVKAGKVTLDCCVAATQSSGTIDGMTVFYWEEQ